MKNSPNNNGAGANLFYASYNNSIAYGSQLSMMNTTLSSFITVQDNDDPDNGPAFYFQQFYDKVVVVPENMFTVPDGSSKKKGRRQAFVNPDFQLPSEWTQKKQLTFPGQKPWFCVWNGTFLEGFIYVQENASSSSASATATNGTNATAAPTTPPPTSMVAPSTSMNSPTPSPTVPNTASSSPTLEPGEMTTVISDALTTATYSGAASQFAAWSVGVHAQAAASERHREYEEAVANGHPGKHKRSHDISPKDLWSQLDTFPYVIKIEERRLANPSTQPYCQQYQILDNHQANFVTDDDGNPIIIELTEDDPSFSAYESAGVASTKRHKRTVPGGCHCQWMSGE